MANDVLVTIESLKHILPTVEQHILAQLNKNSEIVEEPAHEDIPCVFINGELPESKDYVFGELEYVSKTSKFHAYTLIKLQGRSSVSFPKKNFTVNLYSDEARSIPLNCNFKNWGEHNNFVLKADYHDILHARNVVSAKLWSKIVASRSDYDTLPEELRNSPNNGAIDGFPVRAYINGEYQGLYNWTIPKCDWMFGMNISNPNHAVLCAQVNDNGDTNLENNPCNFSQLWDGNEEYWEVEVGEKTDAVVDSLNVVIQSALDQDLDSLDLQSAIDYFIFQDVILGVDGLANNMLMVTYDLDKWYLSAYDLDNTFDMDLQLGLIYRPDAILGSFPYYNQYSSLLMFIQDSYWNRYQERYRELRKSALSNASIVSEFEKYINIYGEDTYIQDTSVYPDIPYVSENNMWHLRWFIEERLTVLDERYGNN